CYFPKLETINLYDNCLKNLPDEFSNLTALKRLNIGENSFKSIPFVFQKMPNLIYLDFSNNDFTDEILNVDHLKYFKRIDFRGSAFKGLLDVHEFLNLHNLEELILSYYDNTSM